MTKSTLGWREGAPFRGGYLRQHGKQGATERGEMQRPTGSLEKKLVIYGAKNE